MRRCGPGAISQPTGLCALPEPHRGEELRQEADGAGAGGSDSDATAFATSGTDSGRESPGSTRLWKPAIPLVVLAASLCGFSVWSAPALVAFNDDAARPLARTTVISDAPSSVATDREMKIGNTAIAQPKLVPASTLLAISKPKPIQRAVKAKRASAPRLLQAKALRWQPPEAVSSAEGDYVVQSEQFTIIMTRQGGPSAGGQENWQVHVWQVRILAPANNNSQKAIPRKST